MTMLGHTFIPNSFYQANGEITHANQNSDTHLTVDNKNSGNYSMSITNSTGHSSLYVESKISVQTINPAETDILADDSVSIRDSINAGDQEVIDGTESREPVRCLEPGCEDACAHHAQRMRPDLDICVCNPVTDKYTTYEIKIQTINPAFNLKCSHTRRRYNDFCWLRKTLKEHHPMCNCPELPAKKNFSQRFEPQFIVERMKSLEDWIYRLMEEDLFLSDTTVHLFLQSNLTCNQIESYVTGRLSSSIVRQAYKACKRSQNSFMRGMSREPVHKPKHKENTTVTTDCASSSDDDSSYESQKGYSSSSEGFTGCSPAQDINTSQRRIDYRQSVQSVDSDYSVDESCVSMSVNSNHSYEFSEMGEGPGHETEKSSRTQTSSPPREVQRVVNGVIFSVNSI